MKLELTKEQYKLLIKMAYLGNWIINGAAEEEDENYVQLEQYIMKNAKNFQLDDLVEFDEEIGYFLLNNDVENEVNALIDEYEDEVFWDALENRLTERDLQNKYTQETFSKISKENKIQEFIKVNEYYQKEFENNGLDNLKIVSKDNIKQKK